MIMDLIKHLINVLSILRIELFINPVYEKFKRFSSSNRINVRTNNVTHFYKEKFIVRITCDERKCE